MADAEEDETERAFPEAAVEELERGLLRNDESVGTTTVGEVVTMVGGGEAAVSVEEGDFFLGKRCFRRVETDVKDDNREDAGRSETDEEDNGGCFSSSIRGRT
jgi:hypothetical protein